MDRGWTIGIEHRTTVPVGRTVAVRLVLSTARRERTESGTDAGLGRAIHADTFLWCAENDEGAPRARLRHQSQRVRPLLRQMGLEAIYPKPWLSEPAPGHRIYPYRLRHVVITRPNQVWSSDITYIRLRAGFIYLVAVIDWFSRYVLSWEISTSLDADFCCSALDLALQHGRPEIFNTDQGSQFTSEAFTSRLEAENILISMDGRGRALDNVFVERLWRTVKYEDVYLKDYTDPPDAVRNLGLYFRFYNAQRPHQALNYQTPEAVFLDVKA